MTIDVMLSYRVTETGIPGDGSVIKLQQALEDQGFAVFVGEHKLEGGQLWAKTIQKAINECHVFVPLCSPTYGDTDWTYREMQLADFKHKPTIPVWHSGNFPPEPVEIFLCGSQRIPSGNAGMSQVGVDATVKELVHAFASQGILPSGKPKVPQAPVPVVQVPKQVNDPTLSVKYVDSDGDQVEFRLTSKGLEKLVNGQFRKIVSLLKFNVRNADLRDQDNWGGRIMQSPNVMINNIKILGQAAKIVFYAYIEYIDSDGDFVEFRLNGAVLEKWVNGNFRKRVLRLTYRPSDGDLRDQDGWGGRIKEKKHSGVAAWLENFVAASNGTFEYI